MPMQLAGPAGAVDVFTISPRTLDTVEYWRNIEDVIRWSERYGCTGVLLFTGNDTYVEPWLVAQHVCATSTLSPLVAVNPIYMHPFTTAKMVASLSYLYRRKICLNVVAGTALSHQEALDDRLPHDARYERLREHVQIALQLLRGEGLTSYEGTHYRVKGARLPIPVPPTLRPDVFLAGQSAPARETARLVNGLWMQMLAPTLDEALTPDARGVHLGLVTRPTDDEAWDAARTHFPASEEGQEVLEMSMANTDAEWKRRLRVAAEAAITAAPGYWLEPFRNFQADCPYFVGSYDRVAALLDQLVKRNVRALILDLPAQEAEFAHVARAFDAARERATAPRVGGSTPVLAAEGR